ncbi:hypothetical protein [Mesorhizobium abyssinicae]|uniref:hypothetical protein n=1 Tax=Mesorhizobium abyssinicae TaxID=1209958 RepID=UPI0033910826
MLETTQGSNALNALQTARQAIDDELRATVPGIKEVDAKFAELARQKDAVQRGQTVLSSGREAPRPEELADEFRQGALPQGLHVGPSAVPLRLREGARAEIERIVGTNANDRVALQRLIKGEGDWNRARLSTLFGSDKAKTIIDLLDRERLFNDTSNIVTRNSETAARIAARDAIDGGGSSGFGVREGFIAGGARGAARAAGTRAVESVIDALRNGGNDKAIDDMARSLTGGPQCAYEGRPGLTASAVTYEGRPGLTASAVRDRSCGARSAAQRTDCRQPPLNTLGGLRKSIKQHGGGADHEANSKFHTEQIEHPVGALMDHGQDGNGDHRCD